MTVSTVSKLDGFKPSSFARAEGVLTSMRAKGGRFSDADVMRTENLQFK